uniref:MARVEL domain-containing protein 2-like n=1 Tax=Sinocyclocheilus rhinocerous TaxID=307959 RepID=A0A673GPK3_9TELE
MSFGNGSASRFDRVRDMPHYDEVPIGSLPWGQQVPYPLGGEVAASSYDSLPPPPLPGNPPVGPDFYPSDVEDQVDDAMDIKPIRRFIPDSVKNFFRASSKKWTFPPPPPPDVNTTSEGVPCSPPHSRAPSPTAPSSYLDPYGGSGGSYNSRKEQATLLGEPLESVSGRSLQTAMTYSEKVEEYNQRYAYMKSWAGLLRILGCAELLLGAAVFACVCAYVHKDNEWFNMFGYSMHQMYGGGYGGTAMAGVCLKLWRHEAARMRRERMGQDVNVSVPIQTAPVMASPESYDGTPVNPVMMEPEILRGHIPAGHIPKPVVIADYVAKYPTIRSDEERERYKAVFNDQYAEYKELHAEVQVLTQKFEEMDILMRSLPQQPSTQMEQERVNSIIQEYNRKKADPTYQEKRERCEYLKNKLAHIKQKIQEYDKVMDWNDGYS